MRTSLIIKVVVVTQVWVRWIDHSTVSLVEVASIKPLKEGIEHRRGKGRKLPRKLQEAIDQALKLHQKRQRQIKVQCIYVLGYYRVRLPLLL